MTAKKSISTRFIVTVCAVILSGQMLGAVFVVLNTRASLLDSLEVRMRNTSAWAAGVCAVPLLNNDSALIDACLAEIVRDGEITSVHIADRNGIVVKEKSGVDQSKDSMNSFFIGEIAPLKTPVTVSGDKVGDIIINYSAFKINKNISQTMLGIVLFQLVFLVLVSFVLMSLFRRGITTPLLSINSAIERIRLGDLSVPVPDTGETEIGGIAKGIAFIQVRLSTIVEKMSATAANVSTAKKKVDHTYHDVMEGVTAQMHAVGNVISSIHKAAKLQAGINESIESLSGFSGENVSSLLEVKTTSEEIAANVQRLFKATEDSYSVVMQMNQSAKAIAESAGRASVAVEDTSASVEEVGASVREVEKHARESARLAEAVRDLTSNIGMMSVVNAVEGMENISEEVTKSVEIIQRLGIRSGDIEKVLSVIKEVTEQTNLLSLNAAILAAQAGEYGKSFSVVADEIRGLSERTSSSTREIGGIVKNIQSDIRDAVYTIGTAQEKVTEGNALVMKVGESLSEILRTAVRSTEMTKAIERATEEQSLGLKQIGSAVDDIRKMMSSVAKSTMEQDSALSYLLEGTGEIKEVAELSKRGALEQTEGTRIISRNLQLANDRIHDINGAVLNQKKLQDSIIDVMEKIGAAGTSMAKDMEDVSASMKTLALEIETLKQDMKAFTIK